MVISSSSVNMKRLKDGNIELCRLFVFINEFLFLFSIKQMKVAELGTRINIC